MGSVTTLVRALRSHPSALFLLQSATRRVSKLSGIYNLRPQQPTTTVRQACSKQYWTVRASSNMSNNRLDSTVLSKGIGSPTTIQRNKGMVTTAGYRRTGLASVCNTRLYESSSISSGQIGDKSSHKHANAAGGYHIFTIAAGIFSSISALIIKLCGYGMGITPYIKIAEADIDKAAVLVEEGARLVIKVADEIEKIAHKAELSAQEAEDFAVKVEATTKLVKEKLDEIADILEGQKNLSALLTHYVAKKTRQETGEASSTIEPDGPRPTL